MSLQVYDCKSVDNQALEQEQTANNSLSCKLSQLLKPYKKDTELYIGLMSGTSIDGLDAALIEVDAEEKIKIIATDFLEWPSYVRDLLNQLSVKNSRFDNIDAMGEAANYVAKYEAKLVNNILQKANLQPKDIVAIGAHGQTIRHRPSLSFSVQIDNGPLLANLTEIDCFTNFRSADIANGGQGAPLTQAFHQKVFSSKDRYRFILNLGGIANMTALGPNGVLLGAFDTGPANTLIDYVCRNFLHQPYDHNGKVAKSGNVNLDDLVKLLEHPYIKRPYPKSTGREDFNSSTIEFMTKRLDLINAKQHGESAEFQKELANILATLVDFTAESVALGIKELMEHEQINPNSKDKDLVLCGGGSLNKFLVDRIAYHTKQLNLKILDCSEFKVDAKFLEAQAFAYFAYCARHAQCLDLGTSTQAQRPSILGCLNPAINGYYKKTTDLLQELTALV